MFYFNHFFEIWLLPPGLNLLLAALAVVFMRYRQKLAKYLLIFSLGSLWLFSTPMIADSLINQLQYHYPSIETEKLTLEQNAAIVVLEAGLNMVTPEYGEPMVSESTLSRLRYAAFLHEKIHAPILVSGNDPTHSHVDQAQYMSQALKDYFNVPTYWQESEGYNTAQEGKLVLEMLQKSHVNKIYLVTHAFHMPRAVLAFKTAGMSIIPAPTGFRSSLANLGPLSSLAPSLQALETTSQALREYIGILWYKVYYRL